MCADLAGLDVANVSISSLLCNFGIAIADRVNLDSEDLRCKDTWWLGASGPSINLANGTPAFLQAIITC